MKNIERQPLNEDEWYPIFKAEAEALKAEAALGRKATAPVVEIRSVDPESTTDLEIAA